MPRHAIDLRRAQVAGQHLFAANDPLARDLNQPVKVHGVDCVLSRGCGGYAMHTSAGAALSEADTRFQAVARAALELQIQASGRDPHCQGVY